MSSSETRNTLVHRANTILQDYPALRWFALAATWLLYGLVFSTNYQNMGVVVGAFALFPVLLAAYFYGSWAALANATLSSPLTVLFLLLNEGTLPRDQAVQIAFNPGVAALILVGGAVGRLFDLTKQVQQSEARFRRLAENAVDIIYRYEFTPTRGFEYVSPSVVPITGYTPEDFYANPDMGLKLAHPDDHALSDLSGVPSSVLSATRTLRWIRRDGAIVWTEHQIVFERDAWGEMTALEGIARDITHVKEADFALQELTERLTHQTHHDALTGLPNRLLFARRLEQAIENARQSGTRVGVLFIDLDRFKQINDTLGHGVGDVLLQQVGQRLEQATRRHDTLARMGGDEFTLVLRDIEHQRDAVSVAQKLLDTLWDDPFEVEGHELYVSASIGISLFPDDGQDALTLQRNADSAMYGSKRAGKNRLHCFDPMLTHSALEQLEMESQLRRALERDELVLYYQPIVDHTGRVVAVEALVRWQHPLLGIISPGDFIPIAEESGLIVPIGAWILQEACRQNQRWIRATGAPRKVAVNVSAIQFARSNFSDVVTRALEESGMDPRLLVIEMTEGVLMLDYAETTNHLTRLRERGVTFSIDDFGTGYSSLSYLQRLPIDTLKIDRSFVSRIDVNAAESDNSAAIVRAITTLGHSLGLGVLAEGVETPDQLDFLHNLGCDYAQGFIFVHPLPAGEIEILYRNGGHLAPRGRKASERR